MVLLEVKDFYVWVEEKEIFCGFDLKVNVGEVYVIMGLNGFGKLMLFYVLVGKDDYEVIGGFVTLDGEDLFVFEFDECAVKGFFFVFQYLIEILGVVLMIFLCIVVNLVRKKCGEEELFMLDFFCFVCECAKELNIKDDMLKCLVNVGFFGGEKKCNEILQMVFFELKMCVLDEIDFGFDIDVLKIVVDGVNCLCVKNCGFFVIMYYQCLFDHIVLDVVYVMVCGKIVCIGGSEFVYEFEVKGYVGYENVV